MQINKICKFILLSKILDDNDQLEYFSSLRLNFEIGLLTFYIIIIIFSILMFISLDTYLSMVN
jgi:hypothetical protein